MATPPPADADDWVRSAGGPLPTSGLPNPRANYWGRKNHVCPLHLRHWGKQRRPWRHSDFGVQWQPLPPSAGSQGGQVTAPYGRSWGPPCPPWLLPRNDISESRTRRKEKNLQAKGQSVSTSPAPGPPNPGRSEVSPGPTRNSQNSLFLEARRDRTSKHTPSPPPKGTFVCGSWVAAPLLWAEVVS